MSFAAFNVRAYFFSCLCYDISPVCFLPCSSFFSAAFCLSSFSSSSFLHCFFASSAFLLFSCSNSAALFLFCSFIFCCLLSLPLCEYVPAGTVHLLTGIITNLPLHRWSWWPKNHPKYMPVVYTLKAIWITIPNTLHLLRCNYHLAISGIVALLLL